MNCLFLRVSHSVKSRHPRTADAPLSIAYAQELLAEQGHLSYLLNSEVESITLTRIKSFVRRVRPEIIFIEVKSQGAYYSLRIAEQFSDCFIVMIGGHPTVDPEFYLYEGSPVNLCIREEFEYTVRDVVIAFETNRTFSSIDGISYYDKSIVHTKRRQLIKDLEKLPFTAQRFNMKKPYYSYFPIKGVRKKWGFLLSSRGCQYNCAFCSPSSRVSYGQKIRLRSPENVVDEIEYLVAHGVNSIYFVDDNFLCIPSHVEGVCKEMIRRDVRVNWAAQVRVDTINKKLLNLMEKAGCSTLCVGVESGSERILKLLNKGISRQDLFDGLKLIKKTSITLVAFIMVGNPTESYEEVQETLFFCKAVRPDLIQVHYFTPYPGTSFTQHVLGVSHYDSSCNLSDMNDLQGLQSFIYRSYYLDPGFIGRYLLRRKTNILGDINLIVKGLGVLR